MDPIAETLPTQPPAARPVAGVLWMLVSGVCFVAVNALVKYSAQDLPAVQAAFMRYALGLVFLLPMLGVFRRAQLGRRLMVLFGTRGLLHAVGVTLWFYAMTQIPLAEVTAMNYMTPIYVSIGAALFLGEGLAARRVIAVVVALLGALVILRPGMRAVESGHIAMLVAAMFFGVSYLMAKKMSGEAPASVVVAMLSVWVAVGLAPFAAVVWITPTLSDVMWMFIVACFATLGHYTMTLAFVAAPVAVTQPVTFVQLVWAVLLGWLVFDESPDIWVIVGGVTILTSVTFMTWREAVLKARRTAAARAVAQR